MSTNSQWMQSMASFGEIRVTLPVIEFLHYQWPVSVVRNLELRGWKQKQTMFLSQLKCRRWHPPHCKIWFQIGVIIVSAARDRESKSRHMKWSICSLIKLRCGSSLSKCPSRSEKSGARTCGRDYFIDLVSLSNGSSELIQLWYRWLNADCERNALPTFYF